MAILNNSNAISSAGGYDINNSLRFRSSASAYLSRTPASAGNRNTWTWSNWIKRGALGAAQDIMSTSSTGTSNTSLAALFFDASGTLTFFQYTSSTVYTNLITTQVFRDPSAWYHIVVAYDDTQATAANRVKIYVNGNQITAFGTATYPTQNYTGFINQAAPHAIGRDNGSPNANYLDGYLADINFIDGSAKTPSDFGETDTTTGVWKPKAYTGTYGTNGFYLKFSDIATTSGSNAGLGKDFSGNGNYWTTNNISVTSGTTYDAMTDSPTLTSATVANYCVLNPLQYQVVVPSQGNLYVAGGNDYTFERGTFWVSTGKWYFEWVSVDSNLPPYVGVAADNITSWSGVTTSGISWYGHSNAYYKNFTGTSLVSTTAISIGDIIGVAFDCDAGTVAYYKNNSLVHTDTTLTPNALVSPVLMETYSGGSWSSAAFNFGQRPFSYTPPTGYVALNTYNLPDSTIKKGSDYFGATLYTGTTTGTGQTQTISHGQSFTPNLVWIKNRSAAHSHQLYDVIRGYGSNKNLKSNSSDEEGLYGDTNGYVSAVSSSQITTVSGSNATAYGEFVNQNTRTYVAWLWAANGAGVTNTSGSITSTVSVSTTAGFSIVRFTSSTNGTVGHGLGVAPKMVVYKVTDTAGYGWIVYHSGITNSQNGGIYFQSTGAWNSDSTLWNNTAPTNSVFTVGSYPNGKVTIAYCWAEIAGFSKFTSYTGNGSSDGPFVYLGFRPKFVMIKSSSAAENWMIMDSSRDTYNVSYLSLFPNLSNAETSGTGRSPQVVEDFLSNGFKIRGANAEINTNGGTYIVAAFAENPFKNSLAR